MNKTKLQVNKNQYKSKKGVSLIIVTMSIVALFAFAGFVIDAAMIFNCNNELQKAAEASALAGAGNFEPVTDASENVQINTTKVESVIKDTFSKIVSINAFISKATIPSISNGGITINPTSKAVMVKSSAPCGTYFVKLLGILNVTVQAQAAAMSAPFYLSPDFPKAAYGSTYGSIITEATGDSVINSPVGDNTNWLNTYSNMYGPPDNKGLALGPGGFVTIRVPIPLIDGPGYDLYIRELGNLKGYYVFAGEDVDPNNPYIDAAIPGGGIKWVNISCTGIPVGTNTQNGSPGGGAYYTTFSYSGTNYTEAKFYGSGYFDLGAKCSNGGTQTYGPSGSSTIPYITSAKYLKIIDDNVEDGFLAANPTYPTLLIGDHSSITPGAIIDSVAVLNHTRLISISDFNTDSDGDGLIDILENTIGTNPNNANTSGMTVNGQNIGDAAAYLGWSFDGSSVKNIVGNPTTTFYQAVPNLPQNMTSPDLSETNIIIYP